MRFLELNIRQIILCIVFIQICLADDEDYSGYTRRCTCLKDSASGYFCADQSCVVTYQRTVIKCFSGRSIVERRDGKLISLSQIQIGEEVLIFNGNKLVYEPIYDIIHSEKNNFYTFIHLTVFNHHRNFTHSIEISSKHLIFKYGILNPVFASQIQIGDYLQLVDQYEIIPGEVIAIDEIVSQGFIAPLTPSGTIVVNELVSSNYAEARNHRLAHLAMQPYRWWRFIFGPKKIIDADLNWYTSVLYNLAEKTGLLHI